MRLKRATQQKKIRRYTFLILPFLLIWNCSNPIPVASALESTPGARLGSEIVFDEATNEMYLFGGSRNTDASRFFDSLWKYSYDQSTWETISSETSPSARVSQGMILIPTHNIIFLFGGMLLPTFIRDSETWIFNLTTQEWHKVELQSAIHPSATSDFGIIYNPFDDCVYIWGGYHDSGHYNALWQFNLTTSTWQEIPTLNTPAGRYGHSWVYNQNDRLAYLFGGRTNTITNDFIALNFTTFTWEQMTVDLSPQIRYWHHMVYMEQSNKGVLFGGSSNSDLDDTWIYNFNSMEWEKQILSLAPEARNSFSMIPVNSLNKVLLFGGFGEENYTVFSDFWEYDLEANEWMLLLQENRGPSYWMYVIFGGIVLTFGVGIILVAKRRKGK